MPLTKYSLDNFVSQQLSQLTECNAPDVVRQFKESNFWISNFILNSILRYQVDQRLRTFAYSYLRKAEAAFFEYDLARNSLFEFVNNSTKKPSAYFKSLTHFEFALSMLCQSYQLAKRISNEKFYEKGDGTHYEKLNKIYDEIRHFKPDNLPTNHFHPVWVTNHGIQIENILLNFGELESLLVEVGCFADKLSQIDFQMNNEK